MFNDSDKVKQIAHYYGFSGLIPFVGSALFVWILPEQTGLMITRYFVYYSAVILSFLAGIIWFSGLLKDTNQIDIKNNAETHHSKCLTASIVFCLLAWSSLLIPATWSIVLLGAGFAVLRQFERKYLSLLYSTFFSQMRDMLTRVVIASHISVLVFALQT